MKNYITIIALVFSTVSLAQPQEPELVEFEPVGREATVEQQQPTYEAVIVGAFKAGNAAKIASYFSENVDLSILDSENIYSQSQAEQILKNFFLKHKPMDFTIVHKGKSGQSEYFIGELTCSDAIFRVTLNSKTDGTNREITALTIEVS